MRAKINEVQTRKIIAKIQDIKSWFFEKINKINKPFRLTRKKENSQIIRNENGNSINDLTEMKGL